MFVPRKPPRLPKALMRAMPLTVVRPLRNDGATGFDFVDVDLLALPTSLDEVESFAYDPDEGRDPHLTLTGKNCNREIVVEIYFKPFEDDEAHTIFDVDAGR